MPKATGIVDGWRQQQHFEIAQSGQRCGPIRLENLREETAIMGQTTLLTTRRDPEGNLMKALTPEMSRWSK